MYDFKADYDIPVNAYVEPGNPRAVFPQHAKPHILDFREHKMAGSGFASIGNFRKMNNPRATQSKYQIVVKTAEEAEAERIQEEMEKQMRKEAAEEEQDDDDEVDISDLKKAYTVDDITEGMNEQLKISKKKKKKGEDANMEVTKVIKKPEPGSRIAMLKKKGKGKKSRSQLKF